MLSGNLFQGLMTSHMGVMAALEALRDAQVDPMDVDLLIWNGAQHKDYPCWLAGLKVADVIGARRAWSFDMRPCAVR